MLSDLELPHERPERGEVRVLEQAPLSAPALEPFSVGEQFVEARKERLVEPRPKPPSHVVAVVRGSGSMTVEKIKRERPADRLVSAQALRDAVPGDVTLNQDLLRSRFDYHFSLE